MEPVTNVLPPPYKLAMLPALIKPMPPAPTTKSPCVDTVNAELTLLVASPLISCISPIAAVTLAFRLAATLKSAFASIET